LYGVPYLVGFGLDISERKETEAKLLREQVFNEAILNSVPGILYLYDEEGSLVRWNKQHEELTGYSGAEMAGMKGLDWFGGREPDTSQMRDAVKRARTQGSGSVEANLIRKDGTAIPFYFTAVALTISGKQYVTGIGIDITERKRSESERAALEAQFYQAQKMESIGQLAGGVAHDFNNILAVILMHLDLMELRPGVDDEMRLSLREVSLGAQRAAALTRQLLLFSRQSAMEVRALDLNELVTNLLKMLGRVIGENITIRFDRNAVTAPVAGDAGMLEQVLLNLALNARDAMPKGGLLTLQIETVRVEVERIQGEKKVQPGPFVCVSVSDNGCGMDEGTRRRIFEPFFTTKPPGKGTGLGLATAYGIVVQHDGWIEFESEEGRGSIFRVFLPAASGPGEGVGPDLKPELQGGTETILYVEDEVNLRWAVARILRRLGYRVLEAHSGPAAIRVWQDSGERFDLLLSDMVMPEGLTGLDLARQFRAQKPELKVIISSGHYSASSVQPLHADQRIEFLPKPYQINVLSATIRGCLDAL
jgi:PAS domain S-box-containing protein